METRRQANFIASSKCDGGKMVEIYFLTVKVHDARTNLQETS